MKACPKAAVDESALPFRPRTKGALPGSGVLTPWRPLALPPTGSRMTLRKGLAVVPTEGKLMNSRSKSRLVRKMTSEPSGSVVPQASPSPHLIGMDSCVYLANKLLHALLMVCV